MENKINEKELNEILDRREDREENEMFITMTIIGFPVLVVASVIKFLF